MVLVKGALMGDGWKGKRAQDRFCGEKKAVDTCCRRWARTGRERFAGRVWIKAGEHGGAFGERQSVGGSVIIGPDKHKLLSLSFLFLCHGTGLR